MVQHHDPSGSSWRSRSIRPRSWGRPWTSVRSLAAVLSCARWPIACCCCVPPVREGLTTPPSSRSTRRWSGPDSLILLLSPSLRQSGELFRKLAGFLFGFGQTDPALRRETASLALAEPMAPGSSACPPARIRPGLLVGRPASDRRGGDGSRRSVRRGHPDAGCEPGTLRCVSRRLWANGACFTTTSEADPHADWDRVQVRPRTARGSRRAPRPEQREARSAIVVSTGVSMLI